MSITSDIRAYADSAFEQGKQAVEQAQAQINDVSEQANELVSKLTGTAKDNMSELTTKIFDTANDAVNELRSQAEKAINLDVLKSAVEPYLSYAKQYRSSVTDRADGILDSVRNDEHVAKLVGTAESLTGAVVESVVENFNGLVVKPVAAITGRSARPIVIRPATKKAATKTPETKTPDAKKTAAKQAPARKATATKPAVTRPVAKATPVKRAPARKATAKKATASKAPAKPSGS